MCSKRPRFDKDIYRADTDTGAIRSSMGPVAVGTHRGYTEQSNVQEGELHIFCFRQFLTWYESSSSLGRYIHSEASFYVSHQMLIAAAYFWSSDSGHLVAACCEHVV